MDTIWIGNDHGGYEMKRDILSYLEMCIRDRVVAVQRHAAIGWGICTRFADVEYIFFAAESVQADWSCA